ncbi:hypothetical protein B0H13DRAFT_1979274, partial [Mycena leptocephala]
MSTNVAIVDASDVALIHYVGTWNDAEDSSEFNNTTKWSAMEGPTVSFIFVGTSISIYGTVGARNPSQASLTFVVDNSITGTYAPPSGITTDAHRETLWASPSMSNGSHTLVITQTETQPDGEIYLDYL